MNKRIVLAILFCVASAASAFAGQVSDVVLDDGSTIRAEVVSLQNDKYTMRSKSLGTFTLEASRVSRISRPGDAPPAASSPTKAPEPSAPVDIGSMVGEAQSKLLGDPAAMSAVFSLAADPAFKEFVSDPEALAALKSGDVEKLKDDPRFKAIMENPQMQIIAGKVQKK